jgi:hypothetical protein
VEGLAERERHRTVPVPAQLQHDGFRAGGRQGVHEAVRMSAGVHDQVRVAVRRGLGREADAERVGHGPPCLVRIDERDPRARKRVAEPGHEAADDTTTDDDDAVTGPRAGVPDAVDGRLHVGGQHRAAGRGPLRQRDDGRGGHHVAVLVGVEAEHGAAPQRRGPLEDLSHVRVAVLHGAREVAFLERRTHHLVLRCGHLPAEDEALRAAADAGEARAHEDVVLLPRRQGRRHDLAFAGYGYPEVSRLLAAHGAAPGVIETPTAPSSEA